MTTIELLRNRGISKALILDDAYDDAPTAADLSQDDEEWSIFFDDLNGCPEDRQLVLEAFPRFNAMTASDMRMSDDFVRAIWQLRGRLSEQLWAGVFEQYDAGHSSDRAFLQSLEEQLAALELSCVRVRRSDDAADVPSDISIVFADLFLGSLQDDDAMSRSVDTITRIRGVLASPSPLFVLMSRSTRLSQKKSDFRDRAGILGASFRVCDKTTLLRDNSVERIVRTLVESQPDAVRLQQFLNAWTEGLSNASSRFLRRIRSLDLPDYGLIGELLLQHEGKGLGSYLLDIWDRVLQFEVEQEQRTIEAAAALNQARIERFPAPHVPGSPELQEIVYQTLFHNPNRLKVDEPARHSPVAFGDVLVFRSALARLGLEVQGAADADATICTMQTDVIVVVTPACDLARLTREQADAKHVLVLPGDLSSLESHKWTYKSGANPRLPILKVGENSCRADWKLKDVRTIPGGLLRRWIERESLIHIGRLREAYSLEVQQLVLSQLGRVGVPAPLPAKFSVQCEAGFVNGAGRYVALDCPSLRALGGELYVGRDGDGSAEGRLLLFEDTCRDLVEAIRRVDAGEVSSNARESLSYLQSEVFLAGLAQAGLEAPTVQGRSSAIEAAISGDGTGGLATVGIVVRAVAGSVDGKREEILKQRKGRERLLVVTIVDDPEWR